MFDFLFRKSLTPFARKLLIIVTISELVLVGIHITLQYLTIPPFWSRLLDLTGAEYGVASTWSSALLLAVALTALVNGLSSASFGLAQRLYFWLVTGVYIYFTLDEYYMFHEGFGPFVLRSWLTVYPIVGVAFVAISLAAYRLAFRGEIGLFALILGGFVIMGASGAGLEFLAFRILCNIQATGYYCTLVGIPEEFLEVFGVAVTLAGLVSYAQVKLGADAWRRAKVIIAGGSLLWSVWVVVQLWALPTLEARLWAKPVQVEYFNGDMSLLGYRTSRNVITPDDRLTVTLYWQADAPLRLDYNLSVQLLKYPEARPVTQTDAPVGGWAGWNTHSWLAGPVVRDVIRLDVPPDLPTPASYFLMVRVWHEWEEVPVTQTDRLLLSPDSLVLERMPALPDEAHAQVPAPPTEANYRFADGFTLSGYSLPDRGVLGETLPLEFWWQTSDNVDGDLIQFIHLFYSNGEDYFVHDQVPFDGTFPTSDWPANMEVRDTLNVPLPDDAPSGEYRVYTGMYSLATGERNPVTDDNGQPVLDNSIYLGTVILEP